MTLTISEQIKIITARAGKSLADIARATGQSPQNLSNKVRRDRWTVDELERIATAAGCTLSVQFLDGDGKPIL